MVQPAWRRRGRRWLVSKWRLQWSLVQQKDGVEPGVVAGARVVEAVAAAAVVAVAVTVAAAGALTASQEGAGVASRHLPPPAQSWQTPTP